jgi:DNA-binding response OmpR family regulator
MTTATLAGRRVLIVEDETLVALLIEDFLDVLGCTYIGPYGTVDAALRAVETECFDVALLDVNLNGEMSYPIAECLERRRAPFLFMSGYDFLADSAGRPWPHLAKPFKLVELEAAMVRALERVPA